MEFEDMISNEVLSWPGVVAEPHRFGAIQFRYGGKEIGHLHGSHTLDLPLPKSERDEFVVSGRVEPHHYLPNSGWVTFQIKAESDVHRAIELCRLNYERMSQKGGGHGE